MPQRGADAQRAKSNVPRLKLSYKEMLESNNLFTFNGLANSSAYHTFLLDEEKGRLFVGAKDHLLSFNLIDINMDQQLKECSNFIKVLQPFNHTHMYACGTGAFHPACAYVEVGKRPENDFGGHRSLVNKWTTFLKARLICSVPGLNGIDTHFDELQDVFLMSSKDSKNPIIYAVFTTSSNIFKGSAVCMYNMADVRRVFLGPYAHRDGPNYQWVPFLGRVPYPRPGTCPSKTFGGFESTKDLPDDVVTFARSHPAMYNPVLPINNRPIIIKTDVDYQFTQIVVDRVEAEDGQYDVMFIGTDLGTVLKVVSIPRGTWHDLEEVLLEEMTVFREPTAITAMELSTKQQQLYLGSNIGVSQMPLHRCDVYGKACAECCLARDPYCAWDGSQCSRYFPTAKRRTRRQDIRNGDPLTQCSDLQHNDEESGESILLDKTVYGVENSSSFLECSPKSQRALIYWQFQRHGEDRKQEKDSGVYYCHAVEHGFIQTLLRLTLHVIPSVHLDDLIQRPSSDTSRSSHGKLWYQDFLSLIDPPGPNSVDQLCEQVWKKERKQRRQKAHHLHASQSHVSQLLNSGQSNSSKWKLMPESKKGRNRRTHEAPRAPRSV
ncbi:Semaphorin-3ab [Bagarius yarrelli]|uniref:Semaphorin-3ab n=1 Tax=Bagarius yarrelli TaxID=175774 RepID=A0A556TQP9_BAGYA|nr:Semaphorin-3ab [Bagarius yarrelli]